MKAAIMARHTASATVGDSPAAEARSRTAAITCSTRSGARTASASVLKAAAARTRDSRSASRRTRWASTASMRARTSARDVGPLVSMPTSCPAWSEGPAGVGDELVDTKATAVEPGGLRIHSTAEVLDADGCTALGGLELVDAVPGRVELVLQFYDPAGGVEAQPLVEQLAHPAGEDQLAAGVAAVPPARTLGAEGARGGRGAQERPLGAA